MVMRKRIKKKQLKQDKFIQKTFELTDWARVNQRTVIFILLGIVLVSVVAYVFISFRRKQETGVYSAFSQSMQAYHSGNFPLAAADLEKMLSEHNGSKLKDEVLYFLASAQVKSGDLDKALATLNRFKEEVGDESKFSHDAMQTLASVFEEKGEHEKAADTYAETAALSQFLYQEKSDRMSAARLFREAGKGEKAAEQYRILIEKMTAADSPQIEIDEIRMYEAEVAAELHTGDRME
jgi:predicted negative regulator of RcsB-dependent stress response